MDRKNTHVLSRARPIRLAFFIELAESSHPILDAVFEYASSIWGGRFALIVPCEDNTPHPEYARWLRAFDPDVIYSYVDISPAMQLEIHEGLYPSELQRHRTADSTDRNPGAFRPDLTLSPLSVKTLLPIAAAPRAFDQKQGIRIFCAMGSTQQDRFLTDSFGTPPLDLQNSLRGSLSEFGSMFFAIRDGELEPRERYIDRSAITVPNSSAVLNAMAENSRVLGAMHLAAMSSARLDLRAHDWSDSFNIVVGNTVQDRILFWNARARIPTWRDGDHVDLCIPMERFDESDFIESLREYMNKRNHINSQAGGGQNGATIRSISVDNAELISLRTKLQGQRSWVHYAAERVANVASCVPSEKVLHHARPTIFSRDFRSSNHWHESHSTSNILTVSTIDPEHLRYVPTALVNPSSGEWAIDLDIGRTVDHSPYSNMEHRWRLPRRLRVTESFVGSYQISKPHGRIVDPRVSSEGLLTLFAAANQKLPEIRVPSDEAAVVTALERGRNWSNIDQITPPAFPDQLCARANRSGAGRYFWGVYQLFGDLNTARSFLLHEFWRAQLQAYHATDQRTDPRREQTKKKLLEKIGNRALNLSDPSQLHTLSEIVLKESDEIRSKVPSLDWMKFKADFKELSDRYDAAHPPGIANLEEELEWRDKTLRDAVQNFCSLGVLHQGYEHKCRKCLHRSWIGISDLRATIVCEVCHDTQPAPVDKPWQFRLNGFLREALQRYGIGPLFWVLSRYQRHNSNSFWFEGPLDIYLTQEDVDRKQGITDIDLTMIDNGLVRMCEVKQSERAWKQPEILAQTMARLRPDIAMIAVMERKSAALERKFKVFSASLSGTGIKPELMTLEAEHDFDDSPFL